MDRPSLLFVAGAVHGVELRVPESLTGVEAVAVHSLLHAMVIVAVLPNEKIENIQNHPCLSG